MTVSVVQSQLITASASTWSGTFSSNVTAGNSIILIATSYDTSTAITSSAPTYNGSSVTGATQLWSKNASASGDNVYTTAWLLPNVSGSSNAVALTVTNGSAPSSNSGAIGLWGLEISGLGSSPTVGTAVTVGGSNLSASPISAGPTAAASSAPGIAIGQSIGYSLVQTNPSTGGWTSMPQATQQFSSQGYQIFTSTGGTFTWSTASQTADAYAGAVVEVYASSTNVTSTGSMGLPAQRMQSQQSTTSAVSLVGTNTATAYTTTNGSNTATNTWGTGQNRLVGNTLVMTITASASTSVSAITAPAGWSTAFNETNSTTSHVTTAVFYKIATGGDAAPSVTVTTSGTTRVGTTLLELSGICVPSPVESNVGVFASGSTSSTITSVAVTTADVINDPACFILAVMGRTQGTAASATWGTPTGFTAITTGTTSSIGHDAIWYKNGSLTAGSTLTATSSITSAATSYSAAGIVSFRVQQPKIWNLSDPFFTPSLNTNIWSTFGDAPSSVGGGYANIPCVNSTVTQSGISGQNIYDLTGNAFFAKLGPDQGGSGYVAHIFVSDWNGGNGLWLGYLSGNLVAYNFGTSTTIGTTTYNATSHAWVRIREASGTIYFDTAPDGLTWTNQWSTTSEVINGYSVYSSSFGLNTYYSSPGATDGTTTISSVNIAPPATGALTVTKMTADEVAASSGVASSTTAIAPPAGGMVRWTAAYINTNDTVGLTFTAADNHGNSFGAPTHVGYNTGTGSGGDGDGGCYLLIWDHVYSSAPGSTTLTITASGSVSAAAPSGALILPYIIQGQASSQSGAAFNSFAEAGTSTTTYELAITPTVLNSAIFFLAAPNHNSGSTGPVAPLSNTVLDIDWDSSTYGSRGTLGRAAAYTSSLTSTTFGFTSANASPFGYGVMASEVIPASSGTTSTGSMGLASLAMSGTSTETFTSTGSATPAALAFAGTSTVLNPVSMTGSFGLASLAFAGTSVETFTSTGSVAMAALAFAGTSVETIASTGTLGLSPLAFSGTSVETFTSTGSVHLAVLAFAGTGTQTFTSTGSFGLAANKFTGTVAETLTSTGTFGAAPLAFSGASTQTFTSTGSIGLAGLAFSGIVSFAGTASYIMAPLGFSGTVSVQNFFTSTGSFSPASLHFAGTEAETFTSTGSIHLAANAFSGTSVVAPPVTTAGTFGLAANTFTGTESTTETSTGSISLAPLGISGIAAIANPITSTGSFAQATLTFMGSSTPVITTYGTIHMPSPSFSGTGTVVHSNVTVGDFPMHFLRFAGTSFVLNPVSTFGHTTLGILGMSGHSVVAPPVTATGHMGLAPNGFLGATGEIVRPTLHDYAAMHDTAAVTVRVFVNDYAATDDTDTSTEEGVAVAVPDYAAMHETVTVNVVLGVKDYAAAHEYFDGFNVPIPSVTISSTFNALTGMETTLASTFIAGKPYQGNNRQIALARWNFMYPS